MIELLNNMGKQSFEIFRIIQVLENGRIYLKQLEELLVIFHILDLLFNCIYSLN